MKHNRLRALLGAFLLPVVVVILLLSSVLAEETGTVSGVIIDDNGPVSGATVRMRATENMTNSGAGGAFTLSSLPDGQKIEITAWDDGYYVATTYVTPTVSGITLTLRPYHTEDHPAYEWASPIAGSSPGACGNCHPMIMPQWENNAHGEAIDNGRFFSLYNGTDLSGEVQVGAGYQNDFPGTAGTCANCHAPAAGVDGYLTTNMNDARGSLTAGIHCDYCHKVGGALINPATGSVYDNTPGAQSQMVLRPPEGDNIFFGPFDDIHDPDTYLPQIAQSQFCAPCHQFSFWGTPIYESYEEWLASPYADAGVTCQDCHMLPNGDTHFALPEVGGLEHPPEKIPSHLQLGAADVDLLQNTVTMTLSTRQIGSLVESTVTIANTGAGHDVPTDFPGRHMILLVTATDEYGQIVKRVAGPTVPAWGGPQAGRPGTAYAKLLRDVASGEMPVISYWKQALIAGDNRIPAFGEDVSTYTFAAPPEGGEVQIEAELIFRRVFYDLAEEKEWDRPDIMMEEESATLILEPSFDIFLPMTANDA